MTIKPDLCIYHANCTDGFAAAWAVGKAFPDARFIPRNYGDPPPNVTGLNVVIVDFSFPLLEMQIMASVAESLTILDHHKSAKEALSALLNDAMDKPESAPLVRGVFDMEKSGARLAWQHFHPGPPPALIRYVEDYDLWRHGLKESRAVNASIQSYAHDFEAYSRLAADLTDPAIFARHVFSGNAILRKHDQIVKGLSENSRCMIIGGFEVPVVNAPKVFASDLGHLLATRPCIQKYTTDAKGIGHEDIDPPPFGAVYFDTPTHREFSLRSSDAQEDVSLIAKKYGGGGHRNAAGFKVPYGWEGDDVQRTSPKG